MRLNRAFKEHLSTVSRKRLQYSEDNMAYTAEEKAAKLKKQKIIAERNLKEKAKLDAAFRANFERLKAERKARDQPAS
jgi:hypothetical protein